LCVCVDFLFFSCVDPFSSFFFHTMQAVLQGALDSNPNILAAVAVDTRGFTLCKTGDKDLTKNASHVASLAQSATNLLESPECTKIRIETNRRIYSVKYNGSQADERITLMFAKDRD